MVKINTLRLYCTDKILVFYICTNKFENLNGYIPGGRKRKPSMISKYERHLNGNKNVPSPPNSDHKWLCR